MEVRKMIKRIADNGELEDMQTLSIILQELMEEVEQCDYNIYKKYEMELYKMAYGDTLTLDMAEEIVNDMRPNGMRWSYEEIRDIKNRYRLDNVSDVDLFIVMNSAYNDYQNLLGEDLENYIKFSMDFIQDEDAKQNKVFLYFLTIPQN